MGNVLGSCLFNVLLIQGTVSVVKAVDVPAIAPLVDLPVMAGIAIVTMIMALGRRVLSIGEGALLFGIYAGYIAWLAMQG